MEMTSISSDLVSICRKLQLFGHGAKNWVGKRCDWVDYISIYIYLYIIYIYIIYLYNIYIDSFYMFTLTWSDRVLFFLAALKMPSQKIFCRGWAFMSLSSLFSVLYQEKAVLTNGGSISSAILWCPEYIHLIHNRGTTKVEPARVVLRGMRGTKGSCSCAICQLPRKFRKQTTKQHMVLSLQGPKVLALH